MGLQEKVSGMFSRMLNMVIASYSRRAGLCEMPTTYDNILECVISM